MIDKVAKGVTIHTSKLNTHPIISFWRASNLLAAKFAKPSRSKSGPDRWFTLLVPRRYPAKSWRGGSPKSSVFARLMRNFAAANSLSENFPVEQS